MLGSDERGGANEAISGFAVWKIWSCKFCPFTPFWCLLGVLSVLSVSIFMYLDNFGYQKSSPAASRHPQ
jgi:hypothetical protein